MNAEMTLAMPWGVVSARTSLGTSMASSLDARTIARMFGDSLCFYGKYKRGKFTTKFHLAAVATWWRLILQGIVRVSQ